MNRSRTLLALIGALAAFTAARAAQAQTTVSTLTVQVAGTASPLKTGLTEAISFSGPVLITATVVKDPALATGVALTIDARGVTGVGSTTGTIYKNTAFANLSRLFAATDTIKTTFAYFADAPGSHMRAKTGLLTLNLVYNATTLALVSASGAVGTL